ncbi:MAG: cyanophycin synthetase [bacterium]|nr:cyanophycin synthetase [bacterium]
MNVSDFKKVQRVHFIGIGGIGISAIARMFLLEGNPSTGSGRVRVSGSDIAESEVTEGLKKAGAAISIGESAQNLPKDADLVIYTIAISKDNTELVEAKKRGITILTYPEALGLISKDKYTIAITGTHGKTTTTAMIAKIMIDAGLDPTVIVGSFLLDTKGGRTNFIAGKGKPAQPDDSGRSGGYLVVEGCEYRRSFLSLHPKILVITNIDADHLDYYRDLDDIKSAFAELAAKLLSDGVLINDFASIRLPEGFRLKIPGVHNLSNAKAALAVAKVLKITEAKALKSLSEFSGTWRRFEYRGKTKLGALVYDDYGHHPHEIEATLQGARELFPTQKIIVVFQPHLYSRTKDHLAGFGRAFKQADEVILLPIYPAREADPGNINSEMVVAEIKKNSQPAHFTSTFSEAADLASKLSDKNGIIITMGAGETNKVADMLVR